MAKIIVDNEIGLIVRGKRLPTHVPDLLEQHADCVLSDGAPVGFYGTGAGYLGVSASTGLGMDGVVMTYDDLASPAYGRIHYVDATLAKKYNLVSTLLLIKVSETESMLFTAAWNEMKNDPGGFSLLGNNCSTHASLAFNKAGVLPSSIPGVDTPDNLYHQLVSIRNGHTRCFSGFLGFTPATGGFSIDML
ncbi:hypothetical protein COO59_13850 [Mixta theicola]|uniref:DUF4105 domain-containing protein n=1 Tax=Mixta theicola TaxID=1458355 RepID=A0A2K1Q7K7_9GAMM|nr:hypothetical protein [Mixta theicola]PNS11012.1 hypothetical protein COO59_13850 [Mixta theicola]